MSNQKLENSASKVSFRKTHYRAWLQLPCDIFGTCAKLRPTQKTTPCAVGPHTNDSTPGPWSGVG